MKTVVCPEWHLLKDIIVYITITYIVDDMNIRPANDEVGWDKLAFPANSCPERALSGPTQ